MFSKLKADVIDGVVCGYISEEGVSYTTKFDYLCMEELNFYMCGNPESVIQYIRQQFEKYLRPCGSDHDIHPQYHDLPDMFFMYWADSKGYTEHGTVIRCSWLTEKGEAFVKAIDEAFEELRNIEGETE